MTDKIYGSFKAQAANRETTGVSRGDHFKIPLEKLEEEPGFNERDYNDPDVVAQIEAFAQAYMAGEFVPPLVTRINPATGIFYIVDGHQRRRGALLAKERGCPIEKLPCIPFLGSDIDRLVVQCKSAQGLQLKPVGIARNYLKLQRLGLSAQEIGVTMGKAPQHVENMLILATANHDVQTMVNAGVVSATTAIEAVKKHGEKAGAILNEKLGEAKALGKTKVKPSAIREWAPPRKTSIAIYATVGTVVDSIKKQKEVSALLKLVDGEDTEALQGQKVLVDAPALYQLLKTYQEAEALKTKRQGASPDGSDAAGATEEDQAGQD